MKTCLTIAIALGAAFLVLLFVVAPVVLWLVLGASLGGSREPTTEERIMAQIDTDNVERWKYVRFSATYELTGGGVNGTVILTNDGTATAFIVNLLREGGGRTEVSLRLDQALDRACAQSFNADGTAADSPSCHEQAVERPNAALFKLDRFNRLLSYSLPDPSFAPPDVFDTTCFRVSGSGDFHECYTAAGVLTYVDGGGAMAYFASLGNRFEYGSFYPFVLREKQLRDAPALTDALSRALRRRDCCILRATTISPR